MDILLVDDHPMVLHSLRTLLQSLGHRITTAGNCRDAQQALLGSEAFDLLLLDYHLPDGSSVKLLREFAQQLPPQVVVISGISDAEETLYMLENTTAKAFIPKNVDLEDLAEAIEAVSALAGGEASWIWKPEARAFLDAAHAYPKERTLSPKERQVFMLMRQGLLDKQIAAQLNRSVHTVRVQLRAIRRKRGATRRGEVGN